MKIKGKITYGANIDKDFKNTLIVMIQIKTDNDEYITCYDFNPKNNPCNKIYSKLQLGTLVEITYNESSYMVKVAENHPYVEIDFYQINNITILDN